MGKINQNHRDVASLLETRGEMLEALKVSKANQTSVEHKLKQIREEMTKLMRVVATTQEENAKLVEDLGTKMHETNAVLDQIKQDVFSSLHRTDVDSGNMKNKIIELERSLFEMDKSVLQLKLKVGSDFEGGGRDRGGSSATLSLLEGKVQEVQRDLKSHIASSNSLLEAGGSRHDALALQCQRIFTTVEQERMLKAEYERHISTVNGTAMSKLKADVGALVDNVLQSFKAEILTNYILPSNDHHNFRTANTSLALVESGEGGGHRGHYDNTGSYVHDQLNKMEKEFSRIILSSSSALNVSREALDRVTDFETLTTAHISSLQHQMKQLEANMTSLYETLSTRVANVQATVMPLGGQSSSFSSRGQQPPSWSYRIERK